MRKIWTPSLDVKEETLNKMQARSIPKRWIRGKHGHLKVEDGERKSVASNNQQFCNV